MTVTGADRSFRVALFVAAVTTAIPLWCARFLPFADLPQHVAAIGMLRHWGDPSWHLGDRYALNVGDSQYFVYHALGALLSLVTGSAETANKVLLTVAAIAFPYASRALLTALGRDQRLALFAPPAFWSAPLMMGFVPYVAAVPVTAWALALFVRQARSPARRGGLLLAAVACALFSLHLSAYLVFLGGAVALAWPLYRSVGAAAKALAWASPSAVLFAAWALRGSLAMPGTAKPETAEVAWSSASTLAEQLPIWAHDIWRSHTDEGCAVVFSLSLVALAVQGWGAPAEDRWLARAAWAPLLVAVLSYAALPYNVGAAVMLDVRMATFVVFFAPLVLTPPLPGRLAGTLPLVAVFVAHLVSVADSAVEIRRAEREELGAMDRLLEEIPVGARVLTLPVHLTSRHTHWPPWVFLGSYHVARAGGEADMSFTRIRHWPVRDVPAGSAAIEARRPLFWTLAPCTFRNAVDGPSADYLLVRAPRDIFRGRPAGPAWRRLDREREWSLYARDLSGGADGSGDWPMSPDQPDLGPCAKDDPVRHDP